MKWLVKSFILVVVGLCVSMAMLVRPLTDQLSAWSLLPQNVLARGVADSSAEAVTATPTMVAAMHAQNAAELHGTVIRINDEFGVKVNASQFSSHHVARDYLERLRLARQAEAMGFTVDPHAFGDDQFMRRYIDALRQGGEPAAQMLLAANAVNDDAANLGPVVPKGRDCIFIYGHKYCRNANGQYVRADGTILETSTLKPPQRGRLADSPSGKNEPLLPSGDLPYDLDELLDMLNPK